MAATITTDQFLKVLKKSDLVEEKRLQAFLATPPSNGEEQAAPRDLAQRLFRQGLLTQFQVNQLLAGKWKGFFLAGGKYKLMDKLGAGGMGHVFLCEHRRMKRLVALKVLPTDKLKDDASAVERFEREARAAAALDHPNIVRAHDIDTDPDKNLHFLVMEFVDGSSLQEIIKKHGPLDHVRACHYIADAARGLQHAHEAGWVHRDIKPGNLLLDRSGALKILDMGLARLFADDSDNLTKRYEKNAVLGTADYLAPEQATNSSDVDIRADIYSLGATFYYLLTGHGPFDEGTVTQKLIWHQTRQPESIRAKRPELPKDLEAVINKMMAKKPVHRYQEPSAVATALEPWTSQPIEPPADEEMPRLCPALLSYSAAGASLPLSAIAGPTSSFKARNRGGPRTASLSRKSMPRMTPAGAPWYKNKWIANKWVAIGGGAAGILFLGFCIAYLFKSPKKDESANARGGDNRGASVTPPITLPANRTKSAPRIITPVPATEFTGEIPPPSEGRLFVAGSKGGSRADVFPTLTAALEKANAGQTITVLVPRIDESLTINSRLAGIHIESGLPPGQLIHWRPPADASADMPLLRLDSVGPAVIKGFDFDGANRLNVVLNVTGTCPGLRLEDLYLTDAGKRAIVFSGASAAKDRPVTLERVRITTLRDYAAPMNQKSTAATRPSAVECTGPSAAAPLDLAIRWCRFEGVFLEAVLFLCPVNATLEYNRFYTLKPEERAEGSNLIKAVSVRGVAPSAEVHLSLVSNTMARFTFFLRLDRLTAGESGYRFVVRNNLILGNSGDAWVFVNTQPALSVARPAFEGSGGNVCRTGTMNFPKQLPDTVVPRKHIAFDELDLTATTDDFLRYKKTGDTAALLTAGLDGGPVGVPPLE
ncbi:MAG TPA: serine/threonine-protein kinase [Gemmataceae bacterium]|nr:serine/threonine-protein kinase [Gemmataceae bacterium]